MEKRINVIFAAALVTGVAILSALFFFDPSRVHIYPVCLFHQFTGLNCPGCGSLRAMHQLLHGNLLEALRLNALLVLSIPIVGWIGFRLWRQRFNGAPALVIRPLWIWIYAGAWLAFGVLRELPVSMFAAWSP